MATELEMEVQEERPATISFNARERVTDRNRSFLIHGRIIGLPFQLVKLQSAPRTDRVQGFN